MPNMSYCVFENTANDLEEAIEKMQKYLDGEITMSDMSSYERKGLKNLIEKVDEANSMLDEVYDKMEEDEYDSDND